MWRPRRTATALAVTIFMTGRALAQTAEPLADAGGDPEMNLLTIQPFVNYNLGSGWTLAFAPIISANWNADDGNEWTVPLGVGISRTTVFNRRPSHSRSSTTTTSSDLTGRPGSS